MRITMICIGSTGDVRPYIVLGRELKARGHDVALCAFATFESLVTQNGLRFLPVSGDAKMFMSNLLDGSSGVAYLKQVRDTLRAFITPFLRDLEEATEGAEAIVATYLGQVLRSFAEMRRVPFVQTHYFPMDLNTQTPISSAPGQHVGKIWNAATYPLAYLLVSTLEKYYLSDWREAHGLAPRKLSTTGDYELMGHTIPVLYALSPLIMPRPTTWGENIHMTGYWRELPAQDYTPPPELEAFLASGEKPVYIGFGSMSSGNMEETLDIVAQAVRQSGVRAVLSIGWGKACVKGREDLYVADYVPHDWLFEQVSAVVHHGGAGTTAAGILAGRPTLIIPFGGDQPFWGNRVHALGIGPRPIARDRLTSERLARALGALTSTPRYRVAARELGQRLRLENGAANAADIIESELQKWRDEEAAKGGA